MIAPLRFNEGSGVVELLDQTLLPVRERWLEIRTAVEMAEAIRMLRVRGAPAIGIAAAYGVVLSARGTNPHAAVHRAAALLACTRPTAVNLFHALDRMRRAAEGASSENLHGALLAEARAIEAEDLRAGRLLAEHGLSLFEDGASVLTHCHTGGLATSGWGTALAPLLLAPERGMALSAYVDETRPLLQGSRITAWELARAGVPATVIADGAAAHVMHEGLVDAVIVGADRIAANGDTANKIGTYSLAVLSDAHSIPFYVSAPVSTVDYAAPSGRGIEIETRAAEEITHGFGRQTAPDGARAYNPAFDVTPWRLISAIVTEHGVVRPPYRERLEALRHLPLVNEEQKCA